MARLRRLAGRRRAREAERAYLVEGPTLVGAALDAGVRIETAFVDSGLVGRATTAALWTRLSAAGAVVHEVRDGTLAGATATVAPQGIVAIASMPSARELALSELSASQGASSRQSRPAGHGTTSAVFVVVLVGVGDPGNAGTILRSAEASGARAVVFCGGSVDAYSPKCVRASAGSLFHVRVVSGGDPVEVLERVGAQGWRRVGASAQRGAPYGDADLQGPVAVVLGSEAHGLTAAVATEIDDWVHIPMCGRVESLNVAVAGALLCFEVSRRHDRSGARPPRGGDG